MLTLYGSSNATEPNLAAQRAISNQRLIELKSNLAKYFGFINGGNIAEALAYSQAVNTAAAQQRSGTSAVADRTSVSAADVRGAMDQLDIRSDPSVAALFNIILDPGSGARKVLGNDASSITKQIDAFMQHTETNATAEQKHKIARCINVHYASGGASPQAETLKTSPDQIFYDNLDSALPFAASDASSPTKRRIAAIRMQHPLLVPGEKNSELLTVFFNAIPTLELTRATPVLNVTVYSSRPITENGKLAAITLQKFVEGSKDVGEPTAQNLPLRAIGLASQVTASLFGQTDNNFTTYSVTGMELFRAPQTLINPEATKQTANYLAPVIDPMRPLASLKSFGIDVKSAYGLQGTRVATVELVLHDRSRMGEFADFIKPDRYGTSFIEVEYGWSHPDPLEANNPYADLLNLTRIREQLNIVTSNFSFDEVGQVNITLNCMGRGSSEMTELTIIGEGANDLRTTIRHMEELSRTITQLSERVFPAPSNAPGSDGNNTHRTEIRGQQALVAAQDATNNLVLSRELMTQMRALRQTLVARESHSTSARELRQRIDELVGNIPQNNMAPTQASAVGQVQTSINREIRDILNRINPTSGTERATKATRYADTFLKTVASDVWRTLTTANTSGGSIDEEHQDAIRQENPPAGQLPATGNNAANANTARLNDEFFASKKVVSLGTLIMAFVAKPLAEMKNVAGTGPKFEEVQIYFYNFNNKASLMSRCNISQFPVQTKYFVREYSRLRMENVSRAVNLSVGEFLNFIASKIVDDVMNPAYKISKLYKHDQSDLVAANATNFDRDMLNAMQSFNVGGHPDFIMPQVTFDVESLPAVVGDGQLDPAKTILRIHIYDKACSANSSMRELLALSTNNLMSTLSSFPGDNTQRLANEEYAAAQHQDVNVLRENWRDLHAKVVRDATNARLIEALPTGPSGVAQYRFTGGPQRLKEYVMKGVPHIIYGAMGTSIRSANLSSMSDPALNTINMQRSLNASPVLANGEQAGGVPLSIYPIELTMTSLGCPFLRYGQEIFIDFNTNTSADNIYYITGLQHKLEAGMFETTIKFTAIDAFGQYRNLIGQLNVGSDTLAAINNTNNTNRR